MIRFWMVLAFYVLLPMAVQAQTPPKPPITTLKPEAEKALQMVLLNIAGEYAGVALYAKTMQKFGRVEPYTHLLAEQVKQRSTVQKLFRYYGIPYPNNPYLSKANAPATLLQAAQVGIERAQQNIALYDRLLPDVAEYDTIRRAFRRLQSATREVHLPLLRAAEANGGVGVTLVIWESCTLSRCFAPSTGGFNLKIAFVKLSREYLFSAESCGTYSPASSHNGVAQAHLRRNEGQNLSRE